MTDPKIPAPGPVAWTRPRPPMNRLCTLSWTCDAWPENGAGVWQIVGLHDMDTKKERWTLRRVMPCDLSQPVGQEISVWRDQYERGGLKVWRGGPDLMDPRFAGAAMESAETYAAAREAAARMEERERLMKVLIYADVRAQGCKKRADDCGSLARTLLEALDAIRAG